MRRKAEIAVIIRTLVQLQRNGRRKVLAPSAAHIHRCIHGHDKLNAAGHTFAQQLQKRLREALIVFHKSGIVVDYNQRQRHHALAGRAVILRIRSTGIRQHPLALLHEFRKL